MTDTDTPSITIVARDPTPTDIARTWIGTPYHHQAATKGAGCDCLGLIRGVYAEFYGVPAEAPPPYTRSWGESDGRELMLEAARRYLTERVLVQPLSLDDLYPNDVLIFRMGKCTVAKHAALYTGSGRIIHSFEGASVSEVNLPLKWLRKIAGVFEWQL